MNDTIVIPAEVISRLMLGKFSFAELAILEPLIIRAYGKGDLSPCRLNLNRIAAESGLVRRAMNYAVASLAEKEVIVRDAANYALSPIFFRCTPVRLNSNSKGTPVSLNPDSRCTTAPMNSNSRCTPETPVALEMNASTPASSPPPPNINSNRRQTDAREATTEAERFAAEIREYVAGLSKGSKATAAEFGVLATSWHAEGFSASLVKAEISTVAKTIRVKDKWPQFVSRNLAEIRRAEKASRKPQDATAAAKPISEPSYFAKVIPITPEAKAKREAEGKAAVKRFLDANPDFKLPSRHAKHARPVR